MKSKLLLLFAFLFLSIRGFSQTNNTERESLICKESNGFKVTTGESDPLRIAHESDFDMKYYRFEWNVNPSAYYISGKATCYFTANLQGLTQMYFNLYKNFDIDSINYHGAKITFTKMGNYNLILNIPQGLNLDVLDSVSITYRGSPPSSGFGSFIKDNHNGIPIVWTLSEPFGAQDWWPCKNGLTDKIDSIDVFVTTPIAYRVASNGLLKDEIVSGDKTTFHWKHAYPIAPYLVAIAITNYSVYTDDVLLSDNSTMPMLNYVYPENLNTAKAGTQDLVKALQYYDSLFHIYPFHKEKYGHAQFNWGGGMEHQTMSFVSSFSYGLLTHELGHQWFGDMVTCGSWEDIWLNEGFATFLEGLAQKRFKGDAAWLGWRTGNINTATSTNGGAVKVSDTTDVNRIFSSQLSYSKGAYLLRMLQWKMGDENFFQAVRNYLNDKEYGFAKTPDFKGHLETVYGNSLTEFFNDWFVGQGFPKYEVIWQQLDNDSLFLKINQTTSHPSVGFYEMPVPIVAKSGSGQQIELRLEHTASGQIFAVLPPFRVGSISFDPDLWLLSKNNVVKKGNITTGITNQNIANKIRLFPNPANNEINIFMDNFSSKTEINWSIVNVLGTELINDVLTNGDFKIDINTLPKGLYFFKIPGEFGSLPFIKQ